MGFFKDFKEDFSEAVNDLVPDVDDMDGTEDLPNATLNEDFDVASELSKLDGLLEQVSKKVDGGETVESADVEDVVIPQEAPKPGTIKKEEITKETKRMDTTMETKAPTQTVTAVPQGASASEETAVITAGMAITGNLESTGSIDVQGMINGNIACNGKLVVTGTIVGNSSSSEFFADAAKIQGEVNSSGTVKVGVGSVIIGNITATSAVIAGAIKGDIDVQGPVVVDTSAVIMGNIKSRSVQINNGAVIEGFCSQCYSEVDVEGLFA
jgi:cytoskeletal protein CcmA (bactofilin family)